MWTSHDWVCCRICCQIWVTGHISIHTQMGLLCEMSALSFPTLFYFIQTFSLHLYMLLGKILCNFKGRFYVIFNIHLCVFHEASLCMSLVHLSAFWLTSSWWYLAVALDLISSFTFFIACVYFTTASGGFQSLKHCELIVTVWIVIICDRHQNKNYLSLNQVWRCFVAFICSWCVWALCDFVTSIILTHAAKFKLILRSHMFMYVSCDVSVACMKMIIHALDKEKGILIWKQSL